MKRTVVEINGSPKDTGKLLDIIKIICESSGKWKETNESQMDTHVIVAQTGIFQLQFTPSIW